MKLTSLEKLLIRSPLRTYMLHKFEAPRVLSKLGISEGNVCLDIGCGNGVGALLLNQYLDCEKIVGVDVGFDMVAADQQYISHPPKWAESLRTDNIEFICEEAINSTFPNNHFNVVFLFGVLHFIKEWKKLISEVYRILKTDGTFAFTEEILLPDSLFRFWKSGLYAAYDLFGGTPICECELETTLEKNGFSIQQFDKSLSMCFIRATKVVPGVTQI